MFWRAWHMREVVIHGNGTRSVMGSAKFLSSYAESLRIATRSWYIFPTLISHWWRVSKSGQWPTGRGSVIIFIYTIAQCLSKSVGQGRKEICSHHPYLFGNVSCVHWLVVHILYELKKFIKNLKKFTHVLFIIFHLCIKFQGYTHYILSIIKKRNFSHIFDYRYVIMFIFFIASSLLGIWH
jgi:hypothetical protein